MTFLVDKNIAKPNLPYDFSVGFRCEFGDPSCLEDVRVLWQIRPIFYAPLYPTYETLHTSRAYWTKSDKQIGRPRPSITNSGHINDRIVDAMDAEALPFFLAAPLLA